MTSAAVFQCSANDTLVWLVASVSRKLMFFRQNAVRISVYSHICGGVAVVSDILTRTTMRRGAPVNTSDTWQNSTHNYWGWGPCLRLGWICVRSCRPTTTLLIRLRFSHGTSGGCSFRPSLYGVNRHALTGVTMLNLLAHILPHQKSSIMPGILHFSAEVAIYTSSYRYFSRFYSLVAFSRTTWWQHFFFKQCRTNQIIQN